MIDGELSVPFITRKMLAFESGAAFSLEVELYSNSFDEVTLSGATKEGAFIYTMLHDAGDYSLRTFSFGLTDIPIYLTMGGQNISIDDELTFVKVYLAINGSRIFTVLSGYIEQGLDLSWPGNQIRGERDGAGRFAYYAGSDPAAGIEAGLATPGGISFELINAHVQLVTDGTVINRRVNLQITDGTNTIFISPSAAVQTASTTIDYYFGVALPSTNDATGLKQYGPLPSGFQMPSAGVISTITTNLQAGDNFGVLDIYAKTFISP